MNLIEKIETDFKDVPDLIIIKENIAKKPVYIVFLETITSGLSINNYILKYIVDKGAKKLKGILPGPNINEILESEIESYLTSGFTIIFDDKIIYAVETKAELSRGISDTEIEKGIYSPKDSLVENYQTNIGLVKRRIKSKDLKVIENKLGKYTNTVAGVMYIDSIAKKELINDVLVKLKDINTEAVLATGDLKQFLIKENKNVFPSVKVTERPDTIVKALLEGKVVIMVDTSPFALIIPTVLADFINPSIDDYTSSINVNFLKILRLICFFITIIAPAYYIAITIYNPETLPTGLLMNIAKQRIGVPFPTIIEAIIMLFIIEILRESDLRFPASYGSAISIIGALILGESAVSAGIASSIMIIVVAITFVSSLMFNDIEINSAIRAWRYVFLAFGAFYGLYGIALAFLLFLINLSSFKTYGLPYLFPITPFDRAYMKETLIKDEKSHHLFRSKYLTDNIRKQR